MPLTSEPHLSVSVDLVEVKEKLVSNIHVNGGGKLFPYEKDELPSKLK